MASTDNALRDIITGEIEEIKKVFGYDVRTIENIGDFAFVVKVTLKDYGCSVKFQITGNICNIDDIL